jgi:hypothetical protein
MLFFCTTRASEAFLQQYPGIAHRGRRAPPAVITGVEQSVNFSCFRVNWRDAK